jgi:hypothetical protein
VKLQSVVRGVRIWMVLFAISFVIAGGLFLFGGEQLFRFFNWEAELLGMAPSPEPSGNQWFHLALVNSLMVTITYLAIAVAVNPVKYVEYLPLLTLSKFTSALTGLVFFFTTRCHSPMCLLKGGLDGTPYFSNLVIFTSDLPLGLIAIVLYVQLKNALAKEGTSFPAAAL